MCVTLEVVNRNSGVLIDKENYTISDILDEKYELSLLFDYYGNMLKENHRIIFEEYILDDMSLSEIATEQGITRQGVHDSIKRSTKHLNDYEQKLGLIKKGKKINETLKQLNQLIRTNDNLDNKEKKNIEDLCKKISREV